MKVRAMVNFSGLITMHQGEERELTNKFLFSDLLEAGYIEVIKDTKKRKAEHENK